MLAGESGDRFVENEAGEFGFAFDLLFGHFVNALDGDFGIFGAVFDEGDATARFEGADNAFEHLERMGEFVVNIDHDGEID